MGGHATTGTSRAMDAAARQNESRLERVDVTGKESWYVYAVESLKGKIFQRRNWSRLCASHERPYLWKPCLVYIQH